MTTEYIPASITEPSLVLRVPMVSMEHIKIPTFSVIVIVHLANGIVRKLQILEVNKKKAVVQVFEGTRSVDTKNYLVGFTGA